MTFVTRHIANNFHVFAQSKEEYRKLLKIATPLSLGYLGHMAIGTTDVLMIGQLGAAPLAASAIVVSIYYTLYLLLTGIIVAITPIASQALGARQARTARRAVRQGMWVALTLSIPGLFLLWHSDKLFSLTGQTKELIPLATDYMHYYMWGMLSGLMFDALRCFMVALGRPQPILVITTIGIIANAILNYALIFGNFGAPEMGLMGAGISSSVVTFLMFLICAFFVATRLPYRRYHVFNRIWKPDWEIYFRIFRLGIPIGGSMMLEQSMYSVSTLLAGRIGAIEAASHSIAMALVNIVYVVSLGISEATTSRVGFNVGRQDSLGVKKAAYAGISTAMGFMFVSAIGVIFFRHELTSYFIGADVSDAAFVLTIAVHLVIVGMLFEFVDATQLGIRGSLHGMNDVKVTFYVSLLGYTVGGTFLAFYLSTYTDLGVYGIWYGMTFGVILTTAILLIRFISLTGRLNFASS